MSDFKAKMHQIVCRLGLCPGPRWGSLQRSTQTPYSWVLGGLLLRKRGRDEKRKERRGGEGKGGEGKGERDGGGEVLGGEGQCRAPS